MFTKLRAQERGAAAVEMALITPLLILMLLGIIDFGRYFFVDISVNSAAHEAARMGALYAVSGQKMLDVTAASAPLAVGMADLRGGNPGMVVSAGACTSATTSTCTLTTVTAANIGTTYCTADKVMKVRVSLRFHWLLPALPDQDIVADGVMICTV